MPKGKIPYQYKATDSPNSLASQYKLTPQQLLNANPGGYPFSTGQNINIPTGGTNINSPAGSMLYVNGQQAPTPGTGSVLGAAGTVALGYQSQQPYTYKAPVTSPTIINRPSLTAGRPPEVARNDLQASAVIYRNMIAEARNQFDATGTFNPATLPSSMSLDMQKHIGYNAETMQQMGYSLQGDKWVQSGTGGGGGNYGGVTPIAGGGGATTKASAFTNTEFYKYYQQNNIGFVNQLRWDPQSKKYVRIGDLLRQGKLDLKGNWHKIKKQKSGGGKKAGNAPTTTGTGSANFSAGAG